MRTCCDATTVSLFRSRDEEATRLQSFVLADSRSQASADLDIAGVQRVDASFDAEAFTTSAQSVFLAVRAAINTGSLDAVTGRFAPALGAVMGNQLRYAVSTAHVQTMTSVDHVAASLRGVEALSSGDIVCVVRYDVDGRLGQVLLGADVSPETQVAALPTRHWYETWRFSRPAGAPTPPPATACPSCGAPASGESHCHYCNTLLIDSTASFRIDSIECMG